MAFKYQPVPQRIQDCIRQFDYHASLGNCPTNWRTQIDLSTVRFGIDSYNDNFPAKVFGSWENAKWLGQFGWSLRLEDLACRASKEVGTLELRKQWEIALRSDKTWENNSGVFQKTIKGCLVSIHSENGRWRIYLTRNENSSRVGSFYSSLASAKRAVRKLSYLI
jgi:hypothetical protein